MAIANIGSHRNPCFIFFSDYSPEDLVKYGSGFRSLWDTNPYLDLEARSKRVHGALRFHRRKLKLQCFFHGGESSLKVS